MNLTLKINSPSKMLIRQQYKEMDSTKAIDFKQPRPNSTNGT